TLQTANISVTATENNCTGPPQNFSITVKPRPTANVQTDRTICAGATLAVNFSGTPGATYSWTNSNPAIGLVTNGVGNISFTAAPVAQTEVATVTFTPELNGCTGASKSFSITVNPLPTMQPPDDVTVCGGGQVIVNFNGAPGTNYGWTNSNPFIGLGASGNGSVIIFTATEAPILQTATVTVTPTALGCTGASQVFDITVNATPAVNPPADVSVCAGKPVNVLLNGSPGAVFDWANSNPGIGLGASGTGNIAFTAANAGGTQTGSITVTPVSPTTGCTGMQEHFTITIIKCCATDAGSLDTVSLFACGPKTMSINHLGNQNLEPNDTLRFILYSDPNDPTGSTVQYSDTLFFPFLPGVTQYDSVYYAAAIAGNLLPNDSIDTADPCFSIFKGPKIRWLKKPTITVGSPPESVCRAGCADVLFDLTGTPPFAFTWLIVQGGQVLLSQNEVSDTFQMVVTVCPGDFTVPAADGYMNFQVNALQDKFCGCGD
ncbi:MAG TPA: hypothetical protein PK228_18620, partial [Saprospiraceae bacterium]|nr:hypothetical protein [Saprospiraceae bacterium]